MISCPHRPNLRLLLSLLFLIWLPLAAMAAPAAQQSPSAGVTLQIGNRTILTLRAPLLGYQPQDRAIGARQRIEQLLARNGPLQVGTRADGDSVTVLIDNTPVFIVLPGDANPLAGETVASVATASADQLRRVISEHHERNDPQTLAQAAGWSLAATIVCVLAGLLWLRLGRQLRERLGQWVRRRAAGIKLAGIHALNVEHGARFVERSLTLMLGLGVALLLYLWATFVLNSLPWTRPWGERLAGFLFGLLGDVLLAIAQAIPGLMLVVVIVLLARFASGVVRAFFNRIEAGSVSGGWLDHATAPATRKLTTGLIWLLALAMAYPYLPGAQTEAFKGLSVLFGLMVSLGASGIVGQVVSGFILVYSRALKVGEYVRIGDTEGTVSELGLFATRIQTGMGEEIVLPNNYITSTPTKNYSRTVAEGKGFVLDTSVTIGYDTPWRQVQALLLQAARATPGIMADPAPYVIQTALSDWYIEYRLVAYAGPETPAKRARVLSDLHAQIIDAFNEYGVQIMSPHYLADKNEPVVVAKQDWHRAPASPPDA